MQHVTAEGTALVKQAEDAASNKKVGVLDWFTDQSYCNFFPAHLLQKANTDVTIFYLKLAITPYLYICAEAS